MMVPLKEGAITEADVTEFYDLPSGKFSRSSDDEITLCKNVGGAHLDLMTRQLADGRAFMLGDQPDLADISIYFTLDFLRRCRNGNERIPDEYPISRSPAKLFSDSVLSSR